MKFKKLSDLISGVFIVGILSLSISALAADLHCSICSMKIPQSSKNHLVLKNLDPKKPSLHACSLSCATKARKYDPKYAQIEVSNFNHPDEFLSGEKAFFLMKSEKIQADLGPMAMLPYFGAFSTKAEAEAAQKKYGDGVIVQGFEGALK